jgi:hypothetical protein
MILHASRRRFQASPIQRNCPADRDEWHCAERQFVSFPDATEIPAMANFAFHKLSANPLRYFLVGKITRHVKIVVAATSGPNAVITLTSRRSLRSKVHATPPNIGLFSKGGVAMKPGNGGVSRDWTQVLTLCSHRLASAISSNV